MNARRFDRRTFLLGLGATSLAAALAACGQDAPASTTSSAEGESEGSGLDELRLDYAYYSPTSLVLREFGWVEEAFEAEGTSVKWVYSAGSNKAIEYLTADGADFGSTAGAAALLARANGVPIKAAYIYSQPEWTALVVTEDSPINDASELAGKKVAATKGTDPYFFLLRTLNAHGLSETDIEVVNLQHNDGRTALERGQVDAWAGLDPHMAASELDAGSRLIYRNPDFNSYGFLNVREEFLEEHPDVTRRVLELYERAREWAQENPDELAEILAEQSSVTIEVAKLELERTNLLASAVPGDEHITALSAVIPIGEAEQLFRDGADPEEALTQLISPDIALQVVNGG